MPENDGRRWFLSLITEDTKRFASQHFGLDIRQGIKRVRCADGLRRELYECREEDIVIFTNHRPNVSLEPVLIFCVFVSVSDNRPERVHSVDAGLLVKRGGVQEKKSIIRTWWDFITSPMT